MKIKSILTCTIFLTCLTSLTAFANTSLCKKDRVNRTQTMYRNMWALTCGLIDRNQFNDLQENRRYIVLTNEGEDILNLPKSMRGIANINREGFCKTEKLDEFHNIIECKARFF